MKLWIFVLFGLCALMIAGSFIVGCGDDDDDDDNDTGAEDDDDSVDDDDSADDDDTSDDDATDDDDNDTGPNYALDFDGGDYAQSMGTLALPGDFTVEGWFNFDADACDTDQYLAANLDNQKAGETGGFRLFTDTSPSCKLYFCVHDEGGVDCVYTEDAPSQEQWIHIAATYSDENLCIWIDGAEAACKSATGAYGDSGSHLFLGVSANGTKEYYYSGLMDEVRISTKVRYEAEFEPDETFSVDSNTAVLYKMNDGEGSLASDSTSVGNHLNLVGVGWMEREPEL